MAIEFKLPELGENVVGGDVVAILVKEGDTISRDQSILELETDKATVEVPSEVAGTVTRIHVSDGDHIEVGQVILSVDESDADGEAAGADDTGAGEPEESAQPEPEPEQEAESEAEPESEQEAESEAAEPEPGTEAGGSEAASRKPADGGAPEKSARARARDRAPQKLVPASPAVRRFAREIGIDIAEISGTGPRGRISIDDVKAFSRETRSAEGAGGVRPASELPDFSRWGTVERERFNNVRRVTASRLGEAWAQVVHVTNHAQADVTRLEELRERHSARVEEAGGKLTVTAILLKTVAAALKVFPKFNASIDMRNEEVVYKQYCNIGVAVDTPKGLLVPVIRDVDRKNIVQLSIELKGAAQKARDGKISLDDLQGGCFTVTNLGGIGGTSFTPIVNYPEVAILGVSRTQVAPVFQDGEFVPRKMLPLSLSYDHRLIDGADAARFLKWLVEALEEPFFLLLEG